MATMARAARATVIRRASSSGGASSAALNKAKSGGAGHSESWSGGPSGAANLKREDVTGSSSEHHIKAAAIAANNYKRDGVYAEFLKAEEVLVKCLSMWEQPDRTTCQNRASTVISHLKHNAEGMTINAEPTFVPPSNRKKIQSSFWEELLEKCVKEHGTIPQKCDIQRQRLYECFGSYYEDGRLENVQYVMEYLRGVELFAKLRRDIVVT